MAKSDVLWIGDVLPTVYEVAQTIYFYSKTIKSDLRSKTITRYVNALRDVWVRSFGEEHVRAPTVIRNKVENVMLHYEKRVRASKCAKSRRMLNKEWMNMDFPQPARGRKHPEKKISDLFHIGKEMDKLTGREKIFFEDQCGARQHLLSHEIDEEYENEKAAGEQEALEREEMLDEEN